MSFKLFLRIALYWIVIFTTRTSLANGEITQLFDSVYTKVNSKNFRQALQILDSFQPEINKFSEKEIGLYLYYMAFIYDSLDELDSALTIYLNAEQRFRKIDKTERVIQILCSVGNIYNRKGHHQMAIQTYLKAMHLSAEMGDSLTLADINTYLGLVYKEVNNYKSALHSFETSIFLYRNESDVNRQAVALNNLAMVFHELKDYNKAKKYYRMAFSIKLNNTINEGQTTTLLNLGELFLETKEYDSARYYLHRAKSNEIKYRNPRFAVAIYHLMSDLHSNYDQFDSSKFYLNLASGVLEDIESRRHQMDHYQYQKTLATKTKDYQTALYWDAKLDSMNQAYFEEERLKTQEIESQFYLDQEKSKSESLQQEKEQQQLIAWILGGFLLTVLALFGIVWRQRKQLRLLNADLQKQKSTIEKINSQNFHFSKNSYTQYAALLGAQIRRLEDGMVKETLIEQRLRIETLNLLYNQLFGSSQRDGGQEVELKPFLTQVIENTADSLMPSDATKQFDFNIADIKLPNEVALNLGVITNELVINAKKYAWGDKNARISVNLSNEGDSINLSITDFGPGLPEHVDWQTSKSFGLSLIRLLSADLEAELSLESGENGLSYYFRIPKT